MVLCVLEPWFDLMVSWCGQILCQAALVWLKCFSAATSSPSLAEVTILSSHQIRFVPNPWPDFETHTYVCSAGDDLGRPPEPMHRRVELPLGGQSCQTQARQVERQCLNDLCVYCCEFTYSLRVVVVLEYKIYVYNFADLKLHDHIETISNPKGLTHIV